MAYLRTSKILLLALAFLLNACSMDIQMNTKSQASQALDLDIYFKDCLDANGMSSICAEGINASSEQNPSSPLLNMNITTSPLQATADIKTYITCLPEASVAIEVLSYTDPLGTVLNSTPEYSQTSICPPAGKINLIFTTSNNACKDIDPSTVACLLKVNAEQNGKRDTEYVWLSESVI